MLLQPSGKDSRVVEGIQLLSSDLLVDGRLGGLGLGGITAGHVGLSNDARNEIALLGRDNFQVKTLSEVL